MSKRKVHKCYFAGLDKHYVYLCMPDKRILTFRTCDNKKVTCKNCLKVIKKLQGGEEGE